MKIMEDMLLMRVRLHLYLITLISVVETNSDGLRSKEIGCETSVSPWSSKCKNHIVFPDEATTSTTVFEFGNFTNFAEFTNEPCVCWCMPHFVNLSKMEFTMKVIDQLDLDKSSLSSNRRKLRSVYEDDMTSVILGSSWIALLLSLYAALFVLDLISCAQGKPKEQKRQPPIKPNANVTEI